MQFTQVTQQINKQIGLLLYSQTIGQQFCIYLFVVGIGCWLLMVVGFRWFLGIDGCWLLMVVGYWWLLVIDGCWLLMVVGY